MRTFAVVLASLLFAGGCTAPERTTALLESQGYTDVFITGWNPLSCSTGEGGDWFSTGFSAKPAGVDRITRGTVCAGLLFKDATIRFEFTP